jgi:hypothetical protein
MRITWKSFDAVARPAARKCRTPDHRTWMAPAVALVCLLAFAARAGTEIQLWHAYTPPSGEAHRAFTISNYKRGIFFGSCGLSTRSLQWSYSFDLTGSGPAFGPDKILFKDEAVLSGTNCHPAGGKISIDAKTKMIHVSLQAGTNNAGRPFLANGDFKYHED